MDRAEAIAYWEGLHKTFSSQLEKEENYFGRMHLQYTLDVLDTTLAALREQESLAQATSEWVSVEERLPERKDARHQRDFYLVALSNGTVKELAYEHDHYDNMLFDVGWHPTAYPVTHWMPLPEPPKEGEEG